MKSFLILSGLLLVGFVTAFGLFSTLSKPLITSIKENRQTLQITNTRAQDISDAKAALPYFTAERRKKLSEALPNPFNVGSRITQIAANHQVTTLFTPSGAILNTTTTGQAQELTGSIKASAPDWNRMQSFVKDLESSSLFVTIKKLTLTPQVNATTIEALIEIGVYVQ